MVDLPEAAGVTVDWDIVRWVGEHHRGAFLAHQRGEVAFRQIVERCDPKVDLAHFEADDLDIEIEADQGELLELLGK
jgi:hypothetical protein